MGTIFHLFAIVEVYIAVPLIVAMFSGMQYVSLLFVLGIIAVEWSEVSSECHRHLGNG